MKASSFMDFAFLGKLDFYGIQSISMNLELNLHVIFPPPARSFPSSPHLLFYSSTPLPARRRALSRAPETVVHAWTRRYTR